MRFPPTILTAILLFAASLAFAQATPQGQGQQQATQAQEQQAQEPAIPITTVAEAEQLPLGSYIFLRGTLLSVLPPDAGSRQPHSLYLQDKTGAIRVICWGVVWNTVPARDQYRRGLIIDVYGKVSEFRGQRQIEIEQANWIRVAPVRQANLSNANGDNGGAIQHVKMRIGALTLRALGENVQITGKVVNYQPSEQDNIPHRVTLDDGTGTIEVVYWVDVSERLRRDQVPALGKDWTVGGMVSEYRGVMQVKIVDPQMVNPKPRAAIPAEASQGQQRPPGQAADGPGAPRRAG